MDPLNPPAPPEEYSEASGPLPAQRPANAVARLSHTHEQIINWLLQNPHRSLRECADSFNYSQSWLSQLIHSDIFQAQLRARQEAVFVAVAQDIPTKLRGLADQAIEKVSELLERTENPDVVVDVFDKALSKLGYAPNKGGSAAAPAQTQVNVFQVSKDDLAAARGIISDTNSSAGGAGGVLTLPTAVPSQD